MIMAVPVTTEVNEKYHHYISAYEILQILEKQLPTFQGTTLRSMFKCTEWKLYWSLIEERKQAGIKSYSILNRFSLSSIDIS